MQKLHLTPESPTEGLLTGNSRILEHVAADMVSDDCRRCQADQHPEIGDEWPVFVDLCERRDCPRFTARPRLPATQVHPQPRKSNLGPEFGLNVCKNSTRGGGE